MERMVSTIAAAEASDASWDLYEMIQAFMQIPSYHLMFEALLILWIFGLWFAKSYKPERTILTEKEKKQLIEEWEPEPLVPDTSPDDIALVNVQKRVVDSNIGKFVSIDGERCLNLATLNFLGMNGRKDIEDIAVATLRKYGVGTCGPRGFYGTMDVHLEIEEKLAKFMKCEEAILYAFGFATIASAIPAYSKRTDVIFADEGVCFAIQKGIQASRSQVKYFKHNDMEDLERLLQEQQEEDRKNPKKAKAIRRFLVVEGLYMNYGDICPLPKLVELKWKYKVRIFMEESLSFSVLGKTGRGVTEHFGISVDDIDLISVSLENAMASIGGFCCGKSYVVDHQRLSGLGYCFSASQPAMLTTSAMKALELLEEKPDMVQTLENNSTLTHQLLEKINGLKVVGDSISPIKHLQLTASSGDRHQDKLKLQSIVQEAQTGGVALTLASYLEKEEHCLPPPSIRLAVSSELKQDDLAPAIDLIHKICDKLL